MEHCTNRYMGLRPDLTRHPHEARCCAAHTRSSVRAGRGVNVVVELAIYYRLKEVYNFLGC